MNLDFDYEIDIEIDELTDCIYDRCYKISKSIF